jgi:hypothetical protein
MDGNISDDEDSDSEYQPRPANARVDLLLVKGRQWREDANLDNVDARSAGVSSFKNPSISWPSPLSEKRRKAPMDYVHIMIPPTFVKLLVANTNRNLQQAAATLTTVEEMWKWLGIVLYFPVVPLPSISDYWATGDYAGVNYPALGSKTGMSRDRWKQIRQHLAFWPVPPEGTSDRWYKIRAIFNTFNTHMASVYQPGGYLTLDETTFRWRGYDEKHPLGPPHLSHMPLKPESVGFLVKDASCGKSRVLVSLELQESASEMDSKEYARAPHNLSKSTACVLRLTQKWHSTLRVVCADSWFANERTAIELRRVGLYFIGVIKTGHSRLPKAWLNLFAFTDASPRGETKCLHSQIDDQSRMIMVAWNEPRKKTTGPVADHVPNCRQFIATCFSAAPAGVWTRERHIRLPEGTNRTTIDVPQPQVVKEYFSVSGAIDQHNQLRQGILELEKHWVTKDWYIRIFQGILGVMFVNAYIAYCYFERDKPVFQEFLALCTWEMCRHPSEVRMTRRRREQTTGLDGIDYAAERLEHSLVSVKEFHNAPTGKSPHGACKMCSKVAYYYCPECSDISGNTPHLFYLCGPRSGRSCSARHLVKKQRVEEFSDSEDMGENE